MIVAGPRSPVGLQIMLHAVTHGMASLPSSKGIIKQLFNFLLWESLKTCSVIDTLGCGFTTEPASG